MVIQYKPTFGELSFRKEFLSDRKTMEYNELYGGIISFPRVKWKSWYRDWVERPINGRWYRYLYDTELQQFVGEISYHNEGRERLCMVDVIIPAKFRGKGYGREGLRILCREAAKNGITVLHDNIGAGNNVAIKLFTSEGFEIVRKTDKEVLLRKQLKPIDKNVRIVETELTPEVLDLLIELSKEWENENSCHGYRANTKEDIEGNRIFIAKNQGKVIGYLFGHIDKTKKSSSVIDKNVPYFEIEELYVRPEFRDWKVGRKLFRFAEKAVSNEAEYLMLSTATKNWRSILHFYIDELGMDFWNARLFKKLGKE